MGDVMAAQKIELIEHVGGEFGVTVIYVWDPESPYFVDFTAVEIISSDVTENGIPMGRGYDRQDADCSPSFVYDPHEAEPYVRGGVKWDGCVNYEVGNPAHVMMHACTHEDLEKLSATLTTIYERCGAIMQDAGVHILSKFQCTPRETTTTP